MKTTEIRKRVAEYMKIGFSLKESFENIRSERRIYTKKSGQKLAEICGNNENRTYSIMDKIFIEN